jgi:hypothetical protein
MQDSRRTGLKIEDENRECLKLNCYKKAHTEENLLIKNFYASRRAL